MTRKMLLIAGVAGLALTPAVAQKADRGGDQQKQERAQRGGGSAQQAQSAERPQRAERQQVQRAERPQRAEREQVQRTERPQRMERQMQRAERPQRIERQQRVERPQRVERQVQRQERQRIERPQRVERQVQRQERPQRIERQQQRVERQAQRPERVERQQQRIERQAQRPERQEQRVERQAVRLQQQVERTAKFDRSQRLERRDLIREARQDIRQDARREVRQQQSFESRAAERLFAPINRQVDYRTARFDGRGYVPLAPIFASRDMRQMEPFSAKFDDNNFVSIGDRYDNSFNWSPVPVIYGSRYFDNDDYYYRYNPDYGYAYQIDRQTNLIGGLFPLFGGYGIGDPWPQTYYSSYVPLGYRDYYYDTPDYYYRNDGYGIYQVDTGSQLITALVSLLLGQNYGVGQVLPASYSAYNVPLDYRASYADNDDSWYRYGDGFIYEVEPYSRRVAARYPLYSDDYYVGERWPVAYPDYNVPYAYRDAYADSPQYHYRYANGGIYQVDPTNQLILALAALVSGDQFAVGQPMPVGYDIYNVPVDYRDRWADSDDEYYRYANGYVYRVDYGSGLIEEAYPVYT